MLFLFFGVTLISPRCRFKDTLECELITVKAFNSPYTVSSYRLAKLSEGFLLEKSQMDRRQTELLESVSEQDGVLDGEFYSFLEFDSNKKLCDEMAATTYGPSCV